MLIQYIGKRSPNRDAIYGTGLWQPGQVKEVSELTGGKLIRHRDCFTLASLSSQKERPETVQDKPKDTIEENREQDLRDAVAAMQDKEAIAEWARIHYGQTISKKNSLDRMKQLAIQMVDQFGAE